MSISFSFDNSQEIIKADWTSANMVLSKSKNKIKSKGMVHQCIWSLRIALGPALSFFIYCFMFDILTPKGSVQCWTADVLFEENDHFVHQVKATKCIKSNSLLIFSLEVALALSLMFTLCLADAAPRVIFPWCIWILSNNCSLIEAIMSPEASLNRRDQQKTVTGAVWYIQRAMAPCIGRLWLCSSCGAFG